MPDLSRGFALVGIALVNVELFATPPETGFASFGNPSSLDRAAEFLVAALFSYKSYGLFSFMVGVGLAYQMTSAQRGGTSFPRRYWRRMTGLFVIGSLHAVFFFFGDILMPYAILGALFYLFRNAGVRTLWIGGVILMTVQVLTLFGFVVLAEVLLSMPGDAVDDSFWKHGTFLGAAAYRLLFLLIGFPFIFAVIAPGILSWFFFGLAAVKSGLIERLGHPFWLWARRAPLPAGLAGSAIGAWLLIRGDLVVSETILGLSAPLASLGYLGCIAKLSAAPRPSRFTTFVERGGRATLSAYLLQSVCLSLIFCDYGLGLYMESGPALSVAIALLVALGSLTAASLWLTRFQRGPVEILFRRFIYGGEKPVPSPPSPPPLPPPPPVALS